jgi:hypothetical protein
MYFGTKSYLKNTHNHTAKHALNLLIDVVDVQLLNYCALHFLYLANDYSPC